VETGAPVHGPRRPAPGHNMAANPAAQGDRVPHFRRFFVILPPRSCPVRPNGAEPDVAILLGRRPCGCADPSKMATMEVQARANGT